MLLVQKVDVEGSKIRSKTEIECLGLPGPVGDEQERRTFELKRKVELRMYKE